MCNFVVQQFACLDDGLCDSDILRAGSGIAAGVVVNNDEGSPVL